MIGVNSVMSVLGTTDKTFLVSVLTLCGNKRLYCIVMYKSLEVRTRKSIYVQRLCLVKLVVPLVSRPEKKK